MIPAGCLHSRRDNFCPAFPPRGAVDKPAKKCYHKSTAQVWCNGNTSASQADNAGSIPVTCSKEKGRRVAALSFGFYNAGPRPRWGPAFFILRCFPVFPCRKIWYTGDARIRPEFATDWTEGRGRKTTPGGRSREGRAFARGRRGRPVFRPASRRAPGGNVTARPKAPPHAARLFYGAAAGLNQTL